MRIALAQFNPVVGDLAGNAARIADLADQAAVAGAALLLTPELALCGYPPEDLALRDDFYAENARVLAGLARHLPQGLAVVVGHPLMADGRRYNAATVLRDGQTLGVYRKQQLPNYSVFDEVRTFSPGSAPCVFEVDGIRFGINICEDIWFPEPMAQAKAAGAEVMLVLNASPFHVGKQTERHAVAHARVFENGLPLIYLNMVGGQDELIFDGGSFAVDAQGKIAAQCPAFEEGLHLVELNDGVPKGEWHDWPGIEASVYQALVVGVRDYIGKNGFAGALVGLSGGIDSALTVAVAADALGPERVHAVMMPSRYTADISLQDAEQLAKNLGIHYSVQPIKPMFDAFLAELAGEFAGRAADTTEENIQARIRGVLLMALSNKFGKLVLTTGNKSEMATGYATLYGDMAGGYAVLKDISKTLVWALSRYRNSLSPVIPERIITRPPSAELKPDQVDQDSLPPYDILDAIMERYVELDRSPAEIVAEGFDEATVRKVVRLIDFSEYKRRQAPPGIRVTRRGFGRDRRYPITNKYRAPFR
ncbi:NAD+ synthase [Sulfuritortus calidifontis]|uniref:NAD+ synthase n=1 Tax=Sulfuritortus calidifontis TaxID=1914471 RepID=UPI000F832D4C|nr:NAD+ synthase [Sulfuritortus calidifontis]